MHDQTFAGRFTVSEGTAGEVWGMVVFGGETDCARAGGAGGGGDDGGVGREVDEEVGGVEFWWGWKGVVCRGGEVVMGFALIFGMRCGRFDSGGLWWDGFGFEERLSSCCVIEARKESFVDVTEGGGDKVDFDVSIYL